MCNVVGHLTLLLSLWDFSMPINTLIIECLSSQLPDNTVLDRFLLVLHLSLNRMLDCFVEYVFR